MIFEEINAEHNEYAPEGVSGAWEPTATDKTYHVPLAEHWHRTEDIKDREGNVLFRFLREEQAGSFRSGIPILRMVIGNTHGQVTALIIREIYKGHDRYTVYGRVQQEPATESSTVLQPVYHLNFNGEEIEMRGRVSISQGVFGKTYIVTSHDHPRNKRKKQIWWKAENKGFRKMLLLCPCLVFFGVWKWNFEFYDLNAGRKSTGSHALALLKPKKTKAPVYSRDQSSRTISVSAGESPLLALCITYAVDRFTRPFY